MYLRYAIAVKANSILGYISKNVVSGFREPASLPFYAALVRLHKEYFDEFWTSGTRKTLTYWSEPAGQENEKYGVLRLTKQDLFSLNKKKLSRNVYCCLPNKKI